MTNEIKVQLDSWRGYSAYEIAVQNGFKGTQKEWLESLSGGTLQITVCGRGVDADGNIVLYADNILMAEGALNTVATKIESLDKEKLNTADVVDSLESDETGKPLSASQGKALNALALAKAEMFLAELTVPAEGWTGEGPYTQAIAVEGMTDTCAVVLGCYPDGGENEEAFADTECKLIERASGGVLLRVDSLPNQEFKANLLVIVPGVSER